MLDAKMIVAGNCTFTIEPPSEWVAGKEGRKSHYTFRSRKAKDAERWFLSFMVGSDNTSDFDYVGLLDAATGGVAKTKASRDIGKTAYRVLESVLGRIFAGEGRVVEDAGWNVHHSGKCVRCGRKLTVPASIQTGIGPECEDFMKLGIVRIDDIPYLPPATNRTRETYIVANLQYVWWKSGMDGTLVVLRDVCLDAGFDDEKADALVNLTRKATRHFKGGKRLSSEFVRYALPSGIKESV